MLEVIFDIFLGTDHLADLQSAEQLFSCCDGEQLWTHRSPRPGGL